MALIEARDAFGFRPVLDVDGVQLSGTNVLPRALSPTDSARALHCLPALRFSLSTEF